MFEEIVFENISNLVRDLNLKIEEDEYIQNRIKEK
jgi:hypothetical protein